MNNKGLTLIEILVVVAIVGILAAIGIPTYIGQQKSAARTEAYTNLQTLRLLEEQFFAENGCYYTTGNPLVCTSATRTGIAQIQVNASGGFFLSRFRPGNEAQFTYSITTGPGAATFTATATGRAGTRVAGDVFWIMNDNNRNF